METISRHATKYRTEKYFKDKLIKNFTDFDLGKKTEVKCTPPPPPLPPSGIKPQALFQFSFQLSQGRTQGTWKKCHKAMLQILQEGGGGGGRNKGL